MWLPNCSAFSDPNVDTASGRVRRYDGGRFPIKQAYRHFPTGRGYRSSLTSSDTNGVPQCGHRQRYSPSRYWLKQANRHLSTHTVNEDVVSSRALSFLYHQQKYIIASEVTALFRVFSSSFLRAVCP